MNNNEKMLVASMRGIALDSINKAGQGHIGMAIGAANITYALIAKNLMFSSKEPKWINRDRFILSAGHGSMAYYSIMHFLGLLSVNDMKAHKCLYSKTPSHPEIDRFDFVDASTGPLGQGIAMGVGMAIAEKHLATKYNTKEVPLLDHYVYVLHGDGCLQEGVALEAIQLAGTLQLDKLILIHDFNEVQIDSRANEVNNIDFIKYFESQNFATFDVLEDDPDKIDEAIQAAKKAGKPSYIRVHTTIAKNTPNENVSKGHNGVLNPEDTINFKKKCGLETFEPFEYPIEVYQYAQTYWEAKVKKYDEWNQMYDKNNKKLDDKIRFIIEESKKSKKTSFADLVQWSNVNFTENDVAIRNHFPHIMNALENTNLVLGGSADLYAATKIGFKNRFDEKGFNIKYGIREFAMCAINNGINLYTNALRTVDSTFLAFADYMKPALRLGSIMELPLVHVFTHDSYQVGGDGPTHQPVDQIPMLRALNGMKVIRPCDQNEVLAAFKYAFSETKNQSAIIGCRQPIKSFKILKGDLVPAYVIKETKDFDISLLASGSEVELAYTIANQLEETTDIKARVISVPLLQDLVKNEKLVKELKLDQKPMFAIEATSDSMWYQLSRYNKIEAHLADGFGHSADGQEVYELKGFTPEFIIEKIKRFLIK
ncbi:transketolase-like TK C-terminal-containing protein [Mycoplasmopsis lipofaciens]|uniref:transketolase-like TK C-terminal-containing protein n=1 Tax=Mycoplasmopsis lipofaciens TaxID=114884 RepID=UPI0004847DB4|nr:transketolase [Mycoplasmopsis lipofaciens]